MRYAGRAQTACIVFYGLAFIPHRQYFFEIGFGGLFLVGVPMIVVGSWISLSKDVADFSRWRKRTYKSALACFSALHVYVIAAWLIALAGMRPRHLGFTILALYGIVFVAFVLFAQRWSRIALALASFVSFMLWIFPFVASV